MNKSLEPSRSGYKICLKSHDDDLGTIEAIVSVFTSPDRGGERVMPGAFARSLSTNLPKGVWMHDWTKPVAKTLEAKELLPNDSLLPEPLKEFGGLYIRAQFNLDTQRGKEAYSDVSKGLVDEFSIGYRVVKSTVNEEEKTLDLDELELFEWSPVLVGMHPHTSTVSIKQILERGSLEGMPLHEHSAAVLAAVKGWSDRIGEVAEMRERQGRDWPSDEQKAQWTETAKTLREFAQQLDDYAAGQASEEQIGLLNARYIESELSLSAVAP